MAKSRPRPPTKLEVYASLAEATGLTRAEVEAVLRALDDEIEKSLQRSGAGVFSLPGICEIVVHRKPATRAHQGINPFTGEATIFKAKPARNVVKIRALRSLKLVAGSDPVGPVSSPSRGASKQAPSERKPPTGSIKKKAVRKRSLKKKAAKKRSTKKKAAPKRSPKKRAAKKRSPMEKSAFESSSVFADMMEYHLPQSEELESSKGPAIEDLFGAGSPSHRFLRAQFPGTVVLRKQYRLLARVVVEGESGDAPLKPFEIPDEGLDLELTLHAPGFELKSSQTQVCHVPSEGDSEPVPFDLIVVSKEPGPLQITAFCEGTYLGMVEIETRAVESGEGSKDEDHSAVIGGGRRNTGNTLNLDVCWDMEKEEYSLKLIEPKRGGGAHDSKTIKLIQPRKEIIQSVITEINRLSKGAKKYSPTVSAAYLRALGIGLWNCLLPRDEQSELVKLSSQYEELAIISSGDPMPWEALHPELMEGRENTFLSDLYTVTRMLKKHKEDAPQFAPQLAYFVASKDPPTTALEEIETISSMLSAKNVTCERLSELGDLLEALNTEFDVIHFACHNVFSFDANKLESSMINVGGEEFNTTFLNNYIGRFGRRPLVFMNACTSAQWAPKFTAMSGWASAFRAAGAGGFVGTLWEVRDKSSSPFAVTWYKSLLEKKTVAESFRIARAGIDRTDPTRIAFTSYIDPAATFVL